MLDEARNTWVGQARQAREVGLQLSLLIDQMKTFATANDLESLIAESLQSQSSTLLGTDMALTDALAYVQLATDITAFLSDPVQVGDVSRYLFMRKVG